MPLALDMPARATKFQFEGEFVFFFVPYAGAWAKNHFETCSVHRLSCKAGGHRHVGEYQLGTLPVVPGKLCADF